MKKNSENENEYARRRRKQELDAAKAARTSSAREAHEELASLFDEKDEDRPSYLGNRRGD